jgi:hypothetical protein
MKLIVILLFMSIIGCTITVKPLSEPRQKIYRSQVVTHKKKPVTSRSTVVDAQWIAEYRKLEMEHGNYRIPDDDRIQARKDGKFQVTPLQLKHFQDLSRAPLPAPTPEKYEEPIPLHKY